MTPDEYRYHSCLRKTPFASRQQARHAASLHSRNLGGQVKPYHCKFETHWHLGHNRSKALRRRDAA